MIHLCLDGLFFRWYQFIIVLFQYTNVTKSGLILKLKFHKKCILLYYLENLHSILEMSITLLKTKLAEIRKERLKQV